MKIKLAILDSSKEYLSRIDSSFGARYADRLELYKFTERDAALSTLHSARIDVFLADESFGIGPADVPKRCGFAYFTDSPDVSSVRGIGTVCKFQKVDLIYKQILGIYAEKHGDDGYVPASGENGRVIAFTPVSGGAGASTAAAAAAMSFAHRGRRTLFLSLEKLGTPDVFFSGEGRDDMSDIIFALSSRSTNLSLKLTSSVRQDGNGVYFFSGAKTALDMFELGRDAAVRLINELKGLGAYDVIIVDADFGLDERSLGVLRAADTVVWVCDGSETSVSKLMRAYTALGIIDESADFPLTDKVGVLYNKFSSKTGKVAAEAELKSFGGIPRYEHIGCRDLAERLSGHDVFTRI